MAASVIEGGTAAMEERAAMITVGSVIRASTIPPTRGAERGKPKKFKNTARPRRPKTIEGTAARLFIFTSMKSFNLFFLANTSK